MMRRLGKNVKMLAFGLAAALALTPCVPAFAADSGNTAKTYKVRIYSGQRGLIDGGQVRELQVTAGERINFYPDSVTVFEEGKYYVKGIRESGRDNKEANASFAADRDMDYVVAYGILGNSVAYTVNYLDGEGNELLPAETFYGNVGDQPVIAYKYIEGWQPQAYNLTKTLSENAAENVFDFIYARTDTGTGSEAGGTGNGSGNGGADNENSAGGTEAEADQPFAGTDGTDGEDVTTDSTTNSTEESDTTENTVQDTGVTQRVEGDADGTGNGADAAGTGTVSPDEQTPLDLQNLDDEQTPLGNIGEGIKSLIDPDGDGLLVNIPKPLVGAVLAVIAFLCVLAVVLRSKRKKEYETNEKS